MTNLLTFGRKATVPSAFERAQEIRLTAATDDLPAARLTSDPQAAETQASLAHVAGDLARKHGLSIERAAMLVARFGSSRHTLEEAAQALRTRMD